MKQRPNAWINVAAFVAAILSVFSGIVLWLMPSGGYRGGRGLVTRPLALGLSHDVWYDLHVWGSLALVALMIVHLVVHWCYIKKLPRILGFKPRKAPVARKQDSQELHDPEPVVARASVASQAEEDSDLCEAAW